MEEYLRLGKELSKKYEEIRHGIINTQRSMETRYERVMKPIHRLAENLPTLTHTEDTPVFVKAEKQVEANDIGTIASKFLSQNKADYIQLDEDGQQLSIGDKHFQVQKNNIVCTDSNQKFICTTGTWKLLTNNGTTKSDKDISKFLEILKYANKEPSNTAPSPTRVSERANKGKKKGKGLNKILTNNPIQYVYWNNPQELVERVNIILGEINAGNKSPLLLNELISIKQEIEEEQKSINSRRCLQNRTKNKNGLQRIKK